MASRSEIVVSQCLRSILAILPEGANIEDSPAFRRLQTALEFFLPSMLVKLYPDQWSEESLDAFRFAVARKTSAGEAELIGLCLFITDQTWTPLHLRLRLADGDAISWVSCLLGARGNADGEVIRIPFEPERADALLTAVGEHPESLDWVYSVEVEAGEPAA